MSKAKLSEKRIIDAIAASKAPKVWVIEYKWASKDEYSVSPKMSYRHALAESAWIRARGGYAGVSRSV